MPATSYSFKDGSSPGAKGYTSDPFRVKVGNTVTNYTVKTDANVDKDGNIIASKLTLQDTVTARSGKTERALAVSFDGGRNWYDPSSGGKSNLVPLKQEILTAEQIKALKPGGSLYTGSRQAGQTSAQKAEASKPQQEQLGVGNVAELPKKDEQSKNFEETENEVNKGPAEGTRENYNGTTILKYPENLQLEHQDCIKFSIFKYDPRGLGLVENRERRRLNKKTPIGTIVLPVPAGISDSNTADWQKDDLDLATAGISDFITQFVSKGKDAGVASAKETLGALSDTDSKTLASIVAVKTAQAVTNTNVLSRAYGQVLNPNSELLFSGPSLRTFSFSFRLSPRSESEAKIVRTIIRYFKQAMSVQRSQSILLLRAPNTFGIEYLTSGQNSHPYLNKFKECALTQCNVNYTPDGQYMTYATEKSMTSYEMQLQFQELEPIFNDDYTDADNGKSDSNIGY
jgi:hypothetical protein